MACILQRDPTGAFTFLAPKDTPTTLFTDSPDGAAVITAAILNGTNVAVDANGKIGVQFVAGVNRLLLTVVGPQVGNRVQLNEVCDASTNKVQQTTVFANNPVIYVIFAS